MRQQSTLGRQIFHFALLLLVWVLPLFPASLRLHDVEPIMERLLSFHIENRELNTTLVRRSVKIFIEQFDAEKGYLLESEVAPYLQLSEEAANQILGRLQRGDYSDFIELNLLFQKAIARAQAIRGTFAKALVENGLRGELPPSSSHFPRTLAELSERQQGRMVRFFQFHELRSRLDTPERRAKAYALFERKVGRAEGQFQFLASDRTPLPLERKEHLLSVRIVKALAKSLDTHTSFFSPEEAYEMRTTLEKQFEGVGVILSEGVDGISIAELIKGSPAQLSGQIQVNDLLVEIDGAPTIGLPFEEVLEMLKQKGRGEVILGFQRGVDAPLFRVALRKQPIVMKDERIETSYEKFGSGVIGKISLHSFYETSDGVTSERDIKEAIRSFREQGELLGLVLDLRENSGGFLTQAVKVAGLFVSNGVIAISKYGRGDVHYLRNIVTRGYFHGPLVVLTSQMSASAAEIVAQALQDYGVALIVGDKRTFGKGSIQYQTVTDPKADLFFKVTVGRYYTVSGKSTQIRGVQADIEVPSAYAPYNIGERFLEYPLPPDEVAAAYVDPLSDLEPRMRPLFEKRYLPHLQRVVSFWKKQLPTLKERSAARLAKNPRFQAFLQRVERVKMRQAGIPANTIDEALSEPGVDLQMEEGVNIVKDMIRLETEAGAQAELLLETGS